LSGGSGRANLAGMWWSRPKHVHRWRLESKCQTAFETHLLYHCPLCSTFMKERLQGHEVANMGPRSTELELEGELVVH